MGNWVLNLLLKFYFKCRRSDIFQGRLFATARIAARSPVFDPSEVENPLGRSKPLPYKCLSRIAINLGSAPRGLSILVAKTGPVSPQQLAASSNFICHYLAGILCVAGRMRCRRNLQALLHQLLCPLISDGPVTRPTSTHHSIVARSTDNEVGSATVVDPNAAIVEVPRIPLLARRTTPLLDHLHAPRCVDRAVVAASVVRRTTHGLLWCRWRSAVVVRIAAD
jgi:hypothetical protein